MLERALQVFSLFACSVLQFLQVAALLGNAGGLHCGAGYGGCAKVFMSPERQLGHPWSALSQNDMMCFSSLSAWMHASHPRSRAEVVTCARAGAEYQPLDERK